MSVERVLQLQERAWKLQADGKFEDALEACTEALRLMEETEGPDSPDVVNLLNELADIESERQNLPAALALAKRAQTSIGRLGHLLTGEDGVRIRLKTLELLGAIRCTLGDYVRAERHLDKAAKVAVAEFGEASPEAVEARNNLGVLYKYWGRFDDGMQLFRRVLDLTPEGSLARSTIYHNIGGILHAQGDFTAAEEPARKAWEISHKLLGGDHPCTMLDAAAYAGVLEGLGKYDDSESIYRRAIEIFEQTYGPDHYEVAASLHGLAATLTARGVLQEAETHYWRALAIKEKLLGADSPDAALTRHNLGNLLNRMGRFAEAVPLLETAVATLQARLPSSHPHLVLARASLRRVAHSSLRAQMSRCT